MAHNNDRKYGRVVPFEPPRKRRSTRGKTALELEFAARIRRRFAAIRRVSRAIQECAEGRQQPLSSVARRVIEMDEGGFTTAEIRAVFIDETEWLIERVRGRHPDRAA